jgi:sulfhydrogenase subunit beta (sulfur reductase)
VPDDGSRHAASNWAPGDALVLDVGEFDAVLSALSPRYQVLGPTVRDGAVVPGPVAGVRDLPAGVRDTQSPGRYEIEQTGDDLLFAWAVGPGSCKGEFFPARQALWRTEGEGASVRFVEPAPEARPLALVGVRPCEVAALGVLDGVLGHGAVPDPGYAARRGGTIVVAVECGRPGGTCFCTSMGTGPGITDGVDLAVTELAGPHRFLVRVGTAAGAELLAGVTGRAADGEDLAARRREVDGAAQRMGRELETEGLAALVARNVEHPRWAEVAERCLSCGNCTLVCPTCFCSDVRDTTDLAGAASRQRTWSSCFDLDHSFIHGGPVRASTASRYRQWMTHKLSTWWDQFDTSGCVGCGRCLTWCPVGIDITEEAAAIRATDGAAATPAGSGSP